MNRWFDRAFIGSALVVGALVLNANQASADTPQAPRTSPMSNPFFHASPLDLQYPQFDLIKDEHFAPAFAAGMRMQLAEVELIANNPEPASFNNTLVPLERSGPVFKRALSVFENLVGADTNDTRDQLEAEFSPKFAAHRDEIFLNPKLFARIKTLYDQRRQLGLNGESQRLVEKYYEDFVRAGALLNPTQKTRLKEINGSLAALTTRFDQNVLAERNASAVTVNDRQALDGLSQQQITAAAEAAKANGQPGHYRIALLNTTDQPVLSQLTNRTLRQRIYAASLARGARGNQWDNTDVVAQVLRLRAERSQLLGYRNYAAYTLAEETAKTPEAVNALLAKLAPPAMANARQEAAELQTLIDREQKARGQASFPLEPWDWAFYAEKLRQAKYNFDESQIKPYLELNNVLTNGVFYAATQLYGLTFKERTDLPKYHPDTRTFDVFDHDGSPLAIFIFDPYARPAKHGGAWMSEYVSQSRLLGYRPVVANHINITKPPAGQPTLLTWDEVITLFHEFGHAVHGMLSNVEYPYFSGTAVPADFVEFPSQFNEMWAQWPSVLGHYAKHYQSGEPMPKALLDKVNAATLFNEGFATTEYLAAAMLDQRLHQAEGSDIPQAAEVAAFEAKALAADGVAYGPIPPRYRTPYFSHIMAGYGAGYYAYIWSEVLAADTSKWIKLHGGLSRENGDRLRQALLSRGGSQDALQLFQDFYGSGPDIQPLLIKRGLVSTPAPQDKP